LIFFFNEILDKYSYFEKSIENFEYSQQFITERFMSNNPLKGAKGENAIKWCAFGEEIHDCVGHIYSHLVLKLVTAKFLSQFKLVTTEKTAKVNELSETYKTATITPSKEVFRNILKN
jgi:cytochrome P450